PALPAEHRRDQRPVPSGQIGLDGQDRRDGPDGKSRPSSLSCPSCRYCCDFCFSSAGLSGSALIGASFCFWSSWFTCGSSLCTAVSSVVSCSSSLPARTLNTSYDCSVGCESAASTTF